MQITIGDGFSDSLVLAFVGMQMETLCLKGMDSRRAEISFN